MNYVSSSRIVAARGTNVTKTIRGACPGYVIDHIQPLACGGEDAPANMQWQTRTEAKEKDRWELKSCGLGESK